MTTRCRKPLVVSLACCAALGALAAGACSPHKWSQSTSSQSAANSSVAPAPANAASNAPPPPINAPPINAPPANDAPAANTLPATSDADLPPTGQAIDRAQFGQPAPKRAATPYDPVLVRAEVLLDRAGFSPGVIDGRDGENFQHALQAFAAAHNLASTGALDPPTWNALAGPDAAPVMQSYVITDDDEAGPFIGKPPTNYQALSKLPALGYTTPVQELSERFHMDPALLAALNPGADFTKAGQALLVAAPRDGPRAIQVARIEVDKSDEAVRAFGSDGQIVAFYPASVGSAERPAPSGLFAVTAVAPHPAYYYDPARLTFTPEGAKGKLRIAPGPNNPVGMTWIALTIPTYGIHGAPDPSIIGKRQSHGCVRLTNWDAVELGKAVKKGVPVAFVGADKPLGAHG